MRDFSPAPFTSLRSSARRALAAARPRNSAQLVETSIVLITAALRLTILVQIGIASYGLWRGAISGTIADPSRPGATIVPPAGPASSALTLVTVLAVVWSIGFFVVVARRGSFLAVPRWLGVADLVIAAATLIVSGWALPQPWWIGTWLIWAPAYVGPVVATIPAWLRSVAGSLAWAAVLALVYVLVGWPGNESQALALLNNALSYLAFAATAALFARFARRLAATADQNQARAVQLAAELELAGYRFHVHNATGLLARFAHDDIPPVLLPALREQAALESNRLRNEVLAAPPLRARGVALFDPAGVAGPGASIGATGATGATGPDASTASTRSLEDVVAAAVAGFSALPLEQRTALGRGVELSSADAKALGTALAAMLYNVQFHAHASAVVVHTDAGQADDGALWWEASVADDGVGFDPQATDYGFGLREQVLASAERHGWTTMIRSAPGEGTLISVRGQAARREDSAEPFTQPDQEVLP